MSFLLFQPTKKFENKSPLMKGKKQRKEEKLSTFLLYLIFFLASFFVLIFNKKEKMQDLKIDDIKTEYSTNFEKDSLN